MWLSLPENAAALSECSTQTSSCGKTGASEHGPSLFLRNAPLVSPPPELSTSSPAAFARAVIVPIFKKKRNAFQASCDPAPFLCSSPERASWGEWSLFAASVLSPPVLTLSRSPAPLLPDTTPVMVTNGSHGAKPKGLSSDFTLLDIYTEFDGVEATPLLEMPCYLLVFSSPS